MSTEPKALSKATIMIMSEEEIVYDWLDRHNDKLPTIAYPKEVFDFIRATSAMYQTGGMVMYKVNSSWQKIIINPKTTTNG